MAIVQTNQTLFIVKSIPVGESVASTYNGKIHLEIKYPDKTVKWHEAGETESGTSVVFTDCTPNVVDAITGEITTAGTPGSIEIDYIPSMDGRYKITVYVGTLNDPYEKVGVISFKAVTDTSYSKVVYTRTPDTEIRYYDIINGLTF